MIDKATATDRQAVAFGSLWTRSHNLLSRVSYVRASPLRILSHALDTYGLTEAKGLNVLEYGFGHGYGLFCFHRSTGLYGVELSEAAIEAVAKRAKMSGYKRVELKKVSQSDPVQIDFPSDFFDVVICSHTIEHVYSDRKLVSELQRVLKPGGKCFFLVPIDVDDTGTLVEEHQRQNPAFPEATYHVWQYNVDTFRWLCEQAGVSIIQIEALDAILDERLKWNRGVQIGASLLFSILPYSLWQKFDSRSRQRGYNYRQCFVAGTKLQRSTASSLRNSRKVSGNSIVTGEQTVLEGKPALRGAILR